MMRLVVGMSIFCLFMVLDIEAKIDWVPKSERRSQQALISLKADIVSQAHARGRGGAVVRTTPRSTSSTSSSRGSSSGGYSAPRRPPVVTGANAGNAGARIGRPSVAPRAPANTNMPRQSGSQIGKVADSIVRIPRPANTNIRGALKTSSQASTTAMSNRSNSNVRPQSIKAALKASTAAPPIRTPQAASDSGVKGTSLEKAGRISDRFNDAAGGKGGGRKGGGNGGGGSNGGGGDDDGGNGGGNRGGGGDPPPSNDGPASGPKPPGSGSGKKKDDGQAYEPDPWVSPSAPKPAEPGGP